MKRKILKAAIKQVKAAKITAETEGEEWDSSLCTDKKIEYIADTLDVKNAAVENRKSRRREMQNLRRAAAAVRKDRIVTENITSEWYFAAGDLVMIKSSRQYHSRRPPAGTVAVIVDTVDHTSYSGVSTHAATITVIHNGQIENWPAKWVKHCE